MNPMEEIMRECCECGSRDTIIKDGELNCNGCGCTFTHE